MSNYLLEILHEEIPASFVDVAVKYLKNETEKQLNINNITYETVKSMATPRRLTIHIVNLEDQQKNVDQLVTGPPAKIAFNDDGSISAVGLKFVESKGLDISTVTKTSTPKGEYLQAVKKSEGIKTDQVLASFIPSMIKDIPFNKTMKWGSTDYKFARPIHSIISLYNQNVLDMEIANIKASKTTKGHRFLANHKIDVTSFDDYIEKLKSAHVILDNKSRRDMIEKMMLEETVKLSYNLKDYDDLLNTVTNLVEYPHPVVGSFDESYLKLPQELLITTMAVNQKFFPLFNSKGEIVNHFIGISNMVVDDPAIIRSGYERVLSARLSDALFFYKNDLSKKMIGMAENLKSVTFHEKLGSSYAKVERFTNVAKYLALKIAPTKVDDIVTASKISKADLMSEMVYEFPDLQGIIGRYYARNEGYTDNIANAIKEHYEPKSANDNLPQSVEGQIISIADKIDTITGFFAINLVPTGNLDPYALRRASIAILNIIVEFNLDISISEIVDVAFNNFKDIVKVDDSKAVEIKQNIVNFILERFKQLLVNSDGITTEIFDAVVSNGDTYPVKIKKLTKLISNVSTTEDFQIIVASFKRISNILKKNDIDDKTYSSSLFCKDEEKAVANAIEKSTIQIYMDKSEFDKALDELLKFAPIINSFFDNVMVMDENIEVRENRLRLIKNLKNLFLLIANLDRT